MKLKKWIQIMLISSSIVTVVGCASKHRNGEESAINEANAAYGRGAQASGLGEESGFGDQAQANGGRRSLSNRTYYFDYDSNVVHDEDKPAILANADYLMGHPHAKIMLEGHTDPRGSREYNIGLGERRAKAVAEMMITKGVNASQIRIVSYGAEKLAMPGRSESDFQRDRRVVVVYLKR